MNENIENMVNLARKDFKIESFPGNFFEYILRESDYINKYNLVLFKQDLGDNISGFIHYTSKRRCYICINYKYSIGHQNFTLAHEIGHKYLHDGISYDDDQVTLKYRNNDKIEEEANEFAAELLYPLEDVKIDLKYIYNNDLFDKEREVELANFVDEIVNRNYISFRFALLRLLFNSKFYTEGNFVLGKVDDVINKVRPLNSRYKKEIYKFVDNHQFYKPFIGILEKQDEIGKILVEQEEMGYDSVQALINKSSELEGFDGTSI